MFVHPLTAVISCPATYCVWRQWRQPRHSCCKNQLSFFTTRNLFTSFIKLSVLHKSDFQRGLHLFSSLMEHTHKEPPLKRRKSIEEKDSVKAKVTTKQEKESREIGPAWLHNVTAIPPQSGKVQSNLEKTGIKTELRRQWEDLTDMCSCGPQADKRIGVQPFDFSVMCYNVLSQDLLLSNPYLYKHCNPLILDWHYRFSNIIKEFEEHSADIMCLQEVQEDHYTKQIKPSLEYLGYHCEYKRRTGHKLDGCVVAFKHSRFKLLSTHPIEFYRRGIPLLDRDNVGLVVMLQPVKELGLGHICVATTHLLYNPRRGDIKLAQLALLLAEISRVSRLDDGTTCPVVLCGDFNSVPASPLYTFIKDNKLEYAGMPTGKVSGQEENHRGHRFLTVPIWPSSLGISQLCQFEEPHEEQSKLQSGASSNGFSKPTIEHRLKLASVYSHFLKESGHPEITTCHSRTAMTVDYIFYSPAQKEKSDRTKCSVAQERGLQLLARLALVSEAELREVNGLPNRHYSSDHLPLIARFRLPS
ncbi:protein angel homolog 2 isoform X2 [Trichomycterus rosablanca]|uniref:protein angel homolog 2 isoform X2 n=1 Tax=Trichomycterus rosablanca TaxID=2290929 RepID=UPI002F3545E6